MHTVLCRHDWLLLNLLIWVVQPIVCCATMWRSINSLIFYLSSMSQLLFISISEGSLQGRLDLCLVGCCPALKLGLLDPRWLFLQLLLESLLGLGNWWEWSWLRILVHGLLLSLSIWIHLCAYWGSLSKILPLLLLCGINLLLRERLYILYCLGLNQLRLPGGWRLLGSLCGTIEFLRGCSVVILATKLVSLVLVDNYRWLCYTYWFTTCLWCFCYGCYLRSTL